MSAAEFADLLFALELVKRSSGAEHDIDIEAAYKFEAVDAVAIDFALASSPLTPAPTHDATLTDQNQPPATAGPAALDDEQVSSELGEMVASPLALIR